MANVRAFRTGNWSDTTATSPWWDGTAIYAPEAGDVVYANSFNIAVDTSVTTGAITNVSATSRLWKDGATTTAAAGGSFTLSHGVTLTADLNSPSNVILCRLAGADSANIVGRIQGATAINTNTVLNSGTGVLAITGDVETVGAPGGAFCVNNSGTGTIAITGNVSGAGQGVGNSSSGSFIITGNVTGASTAGATNSSTGVFTITGNVTAGASTPGATNSSTGVFTIIGDIAASNGAAGFTSPNASATNRLCGSFIAAPNGTAAVYATKFILNNPPLMAKSRYSLDGAGEYVDMFTADNSVFGQPATTDVRAGTVYAGGILTGSCAVPAAGSVALGVPVDNTTGTAALTPADIWGTLTSSLTTAGSIGERLKNCATTQSTGDQLASLLS